MVRFTIRGQPPSLKNNKTQGDLKVSRKGNYYRPTVNNSLTKSYEKFALPQIPVDARRMFEVPVMVIMNIFYTSHRPDLDEAIILDLMQAKFEKHKKTGQRLLVRAGVYHNDRQVKLRITSHGIDRKNPRAEIIVSPLEAEQQALFAVDQFDKHNANARHVGKLLTDELGISW